jgi:tetratricopeptide (TPR) repeat protein
VTGLPLETAFLILLVSAILLLGSSPAQKPAASTLAQDTIQAQNDSPKAPSTSTETENGDVLPNVVLTKEILYRLLAADLAYQRGQWKTAYEITMRIASETRDPRLARRATEIAIGAKQPAETMVAVKLWRELAPHSEDATKYYLGFVLINENLTEAKPILQERLKEATPKVRGVLMFQIQRLLVGVKDKAGAFSLLEELMAPYLGMAEAHVALAQGALVKGDRERATAEAKKALAIKPDFELAALTQAQASENVEQGMALLETFIKTYPKAREVRLVHARMLVTQKKYDQARKEFEALLELQPQDTTTLYSLGVLSAQAKDAKNAERYLTMYMDAFEKQQDDEHDPSRIMLLLAQLADERNDPETAIKWLSQIEPQPGRNAVYIGAQIKTAQLLAKQGNLAEARAKLASAEADEGDEQVQLIMTEAQIVRDAGDAKEALAILDAALKRIPGNPQLLYDHAMVAEKLEKFDIMETSLRKLIAIEPSNQMAFNALGYSLADRNVRLKEAHELIEKANKLAPNDPYIMDSMGWVHFRLNNVKEAEDWLRRAYQSRQEPEIAVHLGEVLWVSGRKEEAMKYWREVLAKEPKNETLKNTLKRFKIKLF